MKRRIVCLVLLIVILCSTILSATASGTITPRFNNTATATANFVISSNGKATVSATYNAYPNYFTTAKITSYIEKRTLGLFWTKVDIGQTDNQWIDTSTDYSDAFFHEFYLENTGTYRAKVIIEISGTGGATDVIDYEQERTYS